MEESGEVVVVDRQVSTVSRQSDYDILEVDPISDDDDDDSSSADGGDDNNDDGVDASSCDNNNSKSKKKILPSWYPKASRSLSVTVTLRQASVCGAEAFIPTSRLYDIDCYYGHKHWRIVRKYRQFEELHLALSIFKAKERFRPGISAQKPKRSLPKQNDSAYNTQPSRGSPHSTSLKFPKKPEVFISGENVERRRVRLENYINQVLKNQKLRKHEATLRFLEISPLSFAKKSGAKYHEGFIEKRSGGQKSLLGFQCFYRTSGIWNKRWLVLKDSYLCYMRKDHEIADVLLFDAEFADVRSGFAETRVHHGVVVSNNTRELTIRCTSYHQARNWKSVFEEVGEACEYVNDHRHESFAPERTEMCKCYVDGSSYFAAVAQGLESAQHEIFITDWWLSPELFLKRPVEIASDENRLDRILLRKAKQGVKIYILLYKEIVLAVGGIQSLRCKNQLEKLHENIKVMRHPDHLKTNIYLWTHHEKLVCIDQHIAFLGGLDLCYGRWDDSDHRIVDVGSVTRVTPKGTPSHSRHPSTSSRASTTLQWQGIGSDDLEGRSRHSSKTSLRSKARSGSLARFLWPSAQTNQCPVKSASTNHLAPDNAVCLDNGGQKKRIFSFSSSPIIPSTEFALDTVDGPPVFCSDSDETIGNGDDVFSDDSEIHGSQTFLPQLASPPPVPMLPESNIPTDHTVTILVHSPVSSQPSEHLDIPLAPEQLLLTETKKQSTATTAAIAATTTTDNDVQRRILLDDSQDLSTSTTDDSVPHIALLKKSQENSNSLSEHNVRPETSEKDDMEMNNNPFTFPFAAALPMPDSDILTSGGFETILGENERPLRSTTENKTESVTVSRCLSAPTNNSPSNDPNDHMAFSPDINDTGVSIGGESYDGPHTDELPFTANNPNDQSTQSTRRKGQNERHLSMDSKLSSSSEKSDQQIVARSVSQPAKSGKKKLLIQSFPKPHGAGVKAKGKNPGNLMKQAETINLPDFQPERKTGKSWSRIRSNIDKLKSVWRHQQETTFDEVDGMVHSKSIDYAEIEIKSSAKYWIGKDYVNWITKDLDTARAPYDDHLNRYENVRMPWHDVGCVVFNKAATDVSRHFIQRWNHTKKVKDSAKSNPKYPLIVPRSTKSKYGRLPDFIKDQCDMAKCQILRSCPRWASGLQDCERSIQNAYLDLISSAEHYIYIENQFFISLESNFVENQVCEVLVNRIVQAHEAGELFNVYIVLPLLPAFEGQIDPQKSGGSALHSVLHWVQQSLTKNDNSLFAQLRKKGLDPNEYVTVCGLRKHSELNDVPVTELVYVHSKVMIVDDRRCIIGSANINDRSLSGDRDSELAVLIEDTLMIDSQMGGKPYKAGKVCHGLRCQLFREHLGITSDNNAILNDISSDEFFKNQWIATAAKNTLQFDKVFNCLPCDGILTFEELRKYEAKDPLVKTNAQEAKELLRKVQGYLVMYPLSFLSHENLIDHLGTKETLVPLKFWT